MKKFLVLALLAGSVCHGQNLLTERIWKISSRKRSIFFDQGVFHSDLRPDSKTLLDIRNSYQPAKGYERIVFDFSGPQPPKVYGHISKEDNKVRLDFFNTDLEKSIGSVSNVKYVKNIDFFNIDKENLSVEMSFRDGVSFDIFYLENPGRIVIDAKK